MATTSPLLTGRQRKSSWLAPLAAVAISLAAIAVCGGFLQFQGSEETAELSSKDYDRWLDSFGNEGQEFVSKNDDPRDSLKKMSGMLKTANQKLTKELASLRKLQKKNREAAKSDAPRGSAPNPVAVKASAAEKKKDNLPNEFSASAITDEIGGKIKAFEKIREKAARYLLKNIAQTLISSLDKGKLDLKEKEAKKAKREQRESARRRKENREGEARTIERNKRTKTESNSKRFQVNHGRYVVVINQNNVNGSPTTPATVTRKSAARKERRDGGGSGVSQDGGRASKSGGTSSAKAQDTASAAKFQPQDDVDRRLSRIAKIAMDSVKELSYQRKQLDLMRDARKKIIREALRRSRRREPRWKKEIRVQAPVIVMSRDGRVLNNADAAISAASKAQGAAGKAVSKAKEIEKSADVVSTKAKAAADSAKSAAKAASSAASTVATSAKSKSVEATVKPKEKAAKSDKKSAGSATAAVGESEDENEKENESESGYNVYEAGQKHSTQVNGDGSLIISGPQITINSAKKSPNTQRKSANAKKLRGEK